MSGPLHKIAVLGGTGKAGKYLVEELLHRNLPVRMLVRNPSKVHLQDPLLEIIEGNARSYNSLRTLLTDCDGILSTLGPSKNEADTCSLATAHIIKIMHEMHVSRYVVVAGLGITTRTDRKSLRTRSIVRILKFFAGKAIADRQKEYALLQNSGLEWTVVRCPLIKLTAGAGQLKTSLEDSPGSSVAAGDLARFLSDQINDKTYVRKAPFISG